ncbi:MAG: Na+/H+ antiporter subunit D [Anaerolineae bacterium]|nr:Na+/H+ antiporter subunit D [Anaerolineae bacterium]
MNLLLVLPIIIPLLTAIITTLLYRAPRLQRWISLGGASALFVVSFVLLSTVWHYGIQVTQIGDWRAPYGITLVADLFSAIMLTVTGIIGFAVVVYSLADIDAARVKFGYHPLYHFLLMGVCGAFITGDLFNLYVWFEVMLMASFVLLALGGEQGQLEGAIKYVTLNLMSSALFLAAMGILYGLVGTLNMADLARKLSATTQPDLVVAVAMLFLVAFGIKAAIFPLFFWLPASYHTPPVAVSAVFAGLLTKVGVYALIRVFTLIFTQNVAYTHTLILILAGLTMITGVLGAVAQNEFRRILSFHIVSQIGYMIMGLGLFTPLGLAASVFYIAHHIIVKTNLFLISGVVARACGTFELKNLGGVYRTQPGLAMLFLIPAMSLAGLPPLSGFFAKLGLVQAGLPLEQYLIVGVALGVSMLTLFSMLKIWNEAFWKPLYDRQPFAHAQGKPTTNDRRISIALFMPIVLLAMITLLIGFSAGPVFALALRAGYDLMQPAQYIRAVLGGS